MRHFLIIFFREDHTHQTLVIQILSLLDSALPEMHFMNLDLLNKMMGVVSHGSTFPSFILKEEAPTKKASFVTVKFI